MSDRFEPLRRRIGYLKKESSPSGQTAKNKKVILPVEFIQKDEYIYSSVQTFPHPLTPEMIKEFPLLNHQWDLDQIVFFDVETTGLSGGAGNLIFLIGIARIENSTLTIEQVFLSDFPGEAGFIEYLRPLLPPEKLYVSYNGKGFDSHTIKTRFLLNGSSIEFPNQFDLLYISRRLFKSQIGSCSLGDIEREILLVSRQNDIPGSLIPDVYFRFLKTRDTTDLVRVFYHNLIDMKSLADLLYFFCRLFSGDCDTSIPVDQHSLGEYFLDLAPQKGIALLSESFNNGNHHSGIALCLYYKGKEDWEKALYFLNLLHEQTKSLFASVELAKYYEHKAKDFRKALSIVDDYLKSHPFLPVQDKEELLKRKNRLALKATSE